MFHLIFIVDSDGDGIPKYLDNDDNGNGIPDDKEGEYEIFGCDVIKDIQFILSQIIKILIIVQDYTQLF